MGYSPWGRKELGLEVVAAFESKSHLEAEFLLPWGTYGFSLRASTDWIRPSHTGLPCGSDGEESACNTGDPGSIPGLEGSPGEGNGYPLQCSCLENRMDRGAWWATAPGVTKSQTQRSN